MTQTLEESYADCFAELLNNKHVQSLLSSVPTFGELRRGRQDAKSGGALEAVATGGIQASEGEIASVRTALASPQQAAGLAAKADTSRHGHFQAHSEAETELPT